MKKNRFLFAAVLFVALSFGIVSCEELRNNLILQNKPVWILNDKKHPQFACKDSEKYLNSRKLPIHGFC